MKTSKIIFVSFFSLIIIFLLTIGIFGFINRNEEKSLIDKYPYEKLKIDLESFSHINIAANCIVNLIHNDSSKIEYLLDKNELHLKAKYRLVNDTLYIESTKKEGLIQISIHYTNLKSIRSTKSIIYSSNIKLDSLYIELNESELTFRDNSEIDFLDLEIKNKSQINIWTYSGNVLNIRVDRSKCYLDSDNNLSELTGIITRNSIVELPKTRKIDLRTDDSSELTIN